MKNSTYNAQVLSTGTKVKVYRLRQPKDDKVWALFDDGGKTTFKESELTILDEVKL